MKKVFTIHLTVREFLQAGGKLKEGMTIYPPSHMFEHPQVIGKDVSLKDSEKMGLFEMETLVRLVDENDKK